MTDQQATQTDTGTREYIAAIFAERLRQVQVEGWTPAHDDSHDPGHLLRAAIIYMHHGTDLAAPLDENDIPLGWPWGGMWWKPKDRYSNLIRSGALCVAERDRLVRAGDKFTGHVDQKFSLVVEKLAALRATTPATAGAGEMLNGRAPFTTKEIIEHLRLTEEWNESQSSAAESVGAFDAEEFHDGVAKRCKAARMLLSAAPPAQPAGGEIEWTPELEAARINLCEFLVASADDKHCAYVNVDLSKRLLEAEQALTILGDIANRRAVPAGGEIGELVERLRAYGRMLENVRFKGSEIISQAADMLERLAYPGGGSREEVGWLIEDGSVPKWWTGWPGYATEPEFWTTDSNAAIRFARRQDAEAYAHFNMGEGNYRITEHMWISPFAGSQ